MIAEASVSLFLVFALMAGTGTLLKGKWDRARCAWKTFEATHKLRIGRASAHPQIRVWIEGSFAHGEGRCNGARERVALPLLE